MYVFFQTPLHNTIRTLKNKNKNPQRSFYNVFDLYTLRHTQNQQYPSIGSDNGLVPTRRQSIIWTSLCGLGPTVSRPSEGRADRDTVGASYIWTNDCFLTDICVTRPQWVKRLLAAWKARWPITHIIVYPWGILFLWNWMIVYVKQGYCFARILFYTISYVKQGCCFTRILFHILLYVKEGYCCTQYHMWNKDVVLQGYCFTQYHMWNKDIVLHNIICETRILFYKDIVLHNIICETRILFYIISNVKEGYCFTRILFCTILYVKQGYCFTLILFYIMYVKQWYCFTRILFYTRLYVKQIWMWQKF